MNLYKKLGVIAACAIFAAPAIADARPYRHHYTREARCAYRNAEGNLITCDGWRYRNTARGWDHSCLGVPYLPSQFACSPK